MPQRGLISQETRKKMKKRGGDRGRRWRETEEEGIAEVERKNKRTATFSFRKFGRTEMVYV